MAIWTEPKNDYTARSQVTPAIFNELAENERHLKEISCNIELKKKSEPPETISGIVLVEV